MFVSFPSIESFRHVVKTIQLRTTYSGRDEYDNPLYENTDAPLPTLTFHGTVKLHGTNAGVVIHPDGKVEAQSRGRTLEVGDDNHGFANFVFNEVGIETWQEFGDAIRDCYQLGDQSVVLYGEWCGKGIMKGTAINQRDGKCFVLFAFRTLSKGDEDEVEEKYWLPGKDVTMILSAGGERVLPKNVYSIYDFPTYEIEIDFKDPKRAARRLEELVDLVEVECPVGAQMGLSGTGEGIVWHCTTPGYEASRFWFKTKGEKHKVTKEKKKVPVDPETVDTVNELLDRTVTENRCLQGIAFLEEQNLEVSRENTGEFLRWVAKDIHKEEIDTIEESGLKPKAINGPISNRAREWFFAYLDKQVFGE